MSVSPLFDQAQADLIVAVASLAASSSDEEPRGTPAPRDLQRLFVQGLMLTLARPQVDEIISVGEFYEKAAGGQVIFTWDARVAGHMRRAVLQALRNDLGQVSSDVVGLALRS